MRYSANWIWIFVSILSVIAITLEVNTRKVEIYGFFTSPKSFSSTSGEVILSQTKKGYKWISKHDIRYTFTFDGTIYDSGVIDFTGRHTEIDRYLTKYPKGKKVTVFYLPDRPWVSALEPSKKSYYIFLVPVFLLGLAIYSAIYAFENKE